MRALVIPRFGPPDVLTITEVAQPSPAPGEMIVAVRAFPVGPGDCKLRAGALATLQPAALPKIAGRYGVGVIVAGTSSPGPFRSGDRIVLASGHRLSGTAAERVVCPASHLARAPSSTDDMETAALIQGGTCAYVLLVTTAGLRPGERVLVHGGAGAVGSATIELARHLGAHVAATCRARDRDFVLALGAHEVVAFDEQDFANALPAQDVVVDSLGGDVHARSYRVLKPGGRLVWLHAEPILDRGHDYGVRVLNARVTADGKVLDAVCRLAEAGVFHPRVARVLPWTEAAAAHALVEAGAIKRGRLVLTVSP